jgi:3-phosphoshikimate 1-carboxyvinyltransferase
MGARIAAREGRFPPFTVEGSSLTGIDYELPVASAQVKSCVLLAGLMTEATTVREPVPARDHTERMLLAAGARIERSAEGRGYRTTVRETERLELEHIEVPGDPSSAAFVIAAAVLVAGSRVTLRDVGVNWTRSGFLRILGRMGAVVAAELEPHGAFGALEPVADLEVAATVLRGTVVEGDEVPLTIDELPLVALLGCFADGETLVAGAEELRVKESDRIVALVEGLRSLGAEIEEAHDGFRVRGTGGLVGGRLDARGDHRLAMLGAVAGLASRDGVEVVGMESAAVSYPTFRRDLETLVMR